MNRVHTAHRWAMAQLNQRGRPAYEMTPPIHARRLSHGTGECEFVTGAAPDDPDVVCRCSDPIPPAAGWWPPAPYYWDRPDKV